jgi:uncharacterized membrane protein
MEKINDYREMLRSRVIAFWEWCLQNHPGKLVGSLIGFFMALTFIIFGFWRTILLIGLTGCGFYLGRRWDNESLPSWLERLLHRILSGSKR